MHKFSQPWIIGISIDGGALLSQLIYVFYAHTKREADGGTSNHIVFQCLSDLMYGRTGANRQVVGPFCALVEAQKQGASTQSLVTPEPSLLCLGSVIDALRDRLVT